MFDCSSCDKAFTTKRGLSVHFRIVHLGFNPNLGYALGLRSAWNKGKRSKTLELLLTKNSKKPYNLKELLIKELGQEYKCAICGQLPIHHGIELILQIDHIDGDNKNQERDNLRFLCPNCHTQTPTFGFKNRKKKRHVIQRLECTPDKCNVCGSIPHVSTI